MNKIEELKGQIKTAKDNINFFEKLSEDHQQFKNRLEAELEELEKHENQEWKPQDNEEYWYINLDMMDIVQCVWYNREIDNTRLLHKVIFKTEDEAREYLEYLKAKEKAMNEFSKEEWENTAIFKYRFCIGCTTKKFGIILETLAREFNALYFRQRQEAQEFINKYEKFLRRELGV